MFSRLFCLGKSNTVEVDQGMEEQEKEHEDQVVQLQKEIDAQKKLVEKQKEDLVKFEAEQDNKFKQVEGQVKQLEKEKDALKQRVIELEEDLRKETEQKMVPIAEFARLICVPNVTHLREHYSRRMLLHLIRHGSSITSRLYVQYNHQQVNDGGLIQALVDLMATAEKPEQMIREVIIESSSFDWPHFDGLTLKGKQSNVSIKFNEASGNPQTHSGYSMAQYELANKDCRFHVEL